MSDPLVGEPIKLTPELAAILSRARDDTSTTSSSNVGDDLDLSDPEIQDLLKRSRRSGNSVPRKHHLVPASYLRRWTEKNQLCVTNVDERRSWVATAGKAARETDFYSMASDDIDPDVIPPLLAETMLSDIEGHGKTAIDQLLEKGVSGLNQSHRSNLAIFLAFQYVRGASTRDMIKKITNDSVKIEYGDLNERGIREVLERDGQRATPQAMEIAKEFLESVKSESIFLAPQNAALIGHAFQGAIPVAELLFSRSWVLYQTPQILLTTDEPVVPVGGPGKPRTERAGVRDSWVILFPLAPGALLAMFRHRPLPHWRRELSLPEVAEINLELLANTTRWGFDRPRRKTALNLDVPSYPVPTQMVEHKVEGRENTSIMRLFRPSRWSGHQHLPSWPVSRWYQ